MNDYSEDWKADKKYTQCALCMFILLSLEDEAKSRFKVQNTKMKSSLPEQ